MNPSATFLAGRQVSGRRGLSVSAGASGCEWTASLAGRGALLSNPGGF